MVLYKNPTGRLVKDLKLMQDHYYYSEYLFQQIYEHIPYENNPLSVKSPKTISLLLYVGPQILRMLEIIKKQTKVTSGDTFSSYYKTLNKQGMLAQQGFVLEKTDKIRYPFTSKNPKWWEAYNHRIKHKLPQGYKQATVQNVIDALGALFILHHIADLKQRHYKRGKEYDNPDILNKDNWFPVKTIGQTIFYHTDNSRSSSNFQGFTSYIFSMDKRFLPHLKGKKVSKPQFQWWE